MTDMHAEGADTLLGVLADAKDDGYTATFTARDDAEIECSACGDRFPAAATTVEHVRRLEGASDPSDMLLVALLACPSCSAKGSLVLGYGPETSEVDARVIEHVDLRDVDHSP